MVANPDCKMPFLIKLVKAVLGGVFDAAAAIVRPPGASRGAAGAAATGPGAGGQSKAAKAFALWSGGDGSVDKDELMAALMTALPDASPSDIQRRVAEAFRKHDSDFNGVLDFSEFERLHRDLEAANEDFL
jgi:hypothetical protein